MEVALRRRLEGVADISISQSKQTAEVTFDNGDHAFSPQAFRKAVDEAGVVVLRFDVDACGVIEQDQQQRWLAAGNTRWRITSEREMPTARLVCASGTLDDRNEPATFDVREVRSAAE